MSNKITSKATEHEIDREIVSEEKGLLRDTYVTALNKVRYANRIKAGLGEHIKNSPKKPIIIKETKWEKIIIWFRKFFTKL